MPREDFIPKKGGKGNMLLSPATLAELREVAARPEVEMDPVQFVKEERGRKVHYRFKQELLNAPRPHGLPQPFQLSRGENGPRIYKGLLEYSITTLHFQREDGKNYFLRQDEIPGILDLSIIGSGSDEEDWLPLGFYGDIYLQWLVDPETCEPTEIAITGPDEPALSPVFQLQEDLTREGGSAYQLGYYVKIGTVPEEGPITQDRTGNVHWAVTFIPENPASDSSSASSSESSSAPPSSEPSSAPSSSAPDSSAPSSVPDSSTPSGGGPSFGDSSSSSGSDKSSNAIVPAPWEKGGYCALATMESNQVLFEFLLTVPLTGRITRHALSSKWLHLCEPDTLTVAASPNGDRPIPVSASVSGQTLTLSTWPLVRPRTVTLKLTGIRKGFANWNLPGRTREQFDANERSIQAMYPR